MEKGKQQAKKEHDRHKVPPASTADAAQPQQFTDSGLTGQGAQSALEHLVERERKRFDRPRPGSHRGRAASTAHEDRG